MEFRNAIFIVTEELSCPIYNVGEEFMVRDKALTVDSGKPLCLLMIQELIKVQGGTVPFERFTQQGVQRAKFECGGCSGLIRFEYKKEKEFATLQMKLLAVAEKRAKMQHIGDFYSLLREMEIFEPLSDNDLLDLTEMLKFKKYGENKVIINKGDRGSHLFIVLSGAVAAVRDGDEVLGEMGKGEIFGEMSLLSGEPIMTSVFTRSAVTVATLSAKDFKHVLNKYPILQVFFYRLLVNRAQINTLRSGNISSGMTGELAEVNAVELFQLINSSGKTGKIDLLFVTGRASVLFYEGEIIRATFGRMDDKEALFAILAKSQGTFTYTSGLSEQDKELPVIGGFMGLIMEGLRRIDEEVEDSE
jgi:CRP-like cAMP-binding protein